MPIANVFQNNMKNKERMTKDGIKKKGKGAKVKLFKKKNTIKTDDVAAELQSAYDKITPKEVKKFSDLPLSYKTQKGLEENDFIEPTEIQRESIGFALQGCDILGAAKTGSGKTLAFLIPVLEKLFCKKWTRLDGTGALIITPTRELAYQIFEMLRKVGFYHDFSAGLIIGGKDLKFERKRMDQCNIVICTPGRLLHHMDENPLFDCVNLQILILDEADRCLDLGFEETMNSIIANLPPNRQTLLFSATQTKSVRDLARLSLKSPKYISVHEDSSYSTPEGLTQSYVVCELEDKLSMLWSFIKNHYKHKILVFLASCKQVKYTFEIFCQLRPGIALLALYGSLHQQKRMDVYKSFCNKEHAVLFATDIAARGLDFPVVNWVIQLDCPEDATTYIHRVGRTARYHKGGEALLVLLPSEAEAMLNNLEQKKIPINEIKINPKKLQNPKVKIEAMLAKKPELKESAQRAFVAYAKSVFLMKDKKVFNVHSLNTDAYARSLGLVVSPRIRFLQKLQKNQSKKEISDDQSLESYNNKVKALELDTSVVKSEPTTDSENDTSDLDSKNKSLKPDGKSSISNILSKIKAKDEIKSEPDSSESSEAVTDNEQNEEEEEEVNDKKNGKLNLALSNVTVAKNHVKSNRFQTFNFGIDDSDSDDEILKIKRSDHALNNEDDEDLLPLDEPGKHKKKAVTKAAIAKRILKKNIVPNKKIVFTEEGQAVEDRFKQRVSELGKKYEEEGGGGGISLEEAQKVLREEDKIDKQLFKERVKMKHREKRIKLKKLRTGKDSDEDNSDDDVEEAEVGSYEDDDSDAEYDSENENVLQSNDSEDSNTDDNGDDDDDDEDDNASPSDSEDDHISSENLSRKGVKRKQDNIIKESTKKFKNSKASLVQDEELALQLLMNKNR